MDIGLDFEGSVERSFAFLLKQGFRLVRSEPLHVRFADPCVSVFVTYDWRGYEVETMLERHRESRPPIALWVALRVLAPAMEDERVWQAASKENLVLGLERMAELTRTRCAALLANHPKAWELVHGEQKRLSEEETFRFQYGGTIKAADRAWASREWLRARTLYSRAAPALDELRRKRLEYLQRRQS